MAFNIYKIALQNDNSKTTKSFFETVVDGAAKSAADRAEVEINIDKKTPDDEDLPSDLQKSLVLKVPCVLLQHPDGTYLMPPLKGIGKRALWEQRYFEIFKKLDVRKAQGETLDIYIICYTGYLASAASVMRAKVRQFAPTDIPYTITEYNYGFFSSPLPEVERLLGDNPNTKYNIVIRFGKLGKVYQIAMYGSRDLWERMNTSLALPYDNHYKDVFKKAVKAYEDVKNGKKVEDVVTNAQKKEKKENEKSVIPGLDSITGQLKKGLMYLGAGVCAYQALNSPTETGQIAFGAGAGLLLFKAMEKEE